MTDNKQPTGMTLREYAAIKAMQGFCSSRETWLAMMMDRKDTPPENYVAQQAIKMADALLKELKNDTKS